jgi:hypothetical protein
MTGREHADTGLVVSHKNARLFRRGLAGGESAAHKFYSLELLIDRNSTFDEVPSKLPKRREIIAPAVGKAA